MPTHTRDWIELNLTEREAKTALKAIDNLLDMKGDAVLMTRGDFSNILLGALDLPSQTR